MRLRLVPHALLLCIGCEHGEPAPAPAAASPPAVGSPAPEPVTPAPAPTPHASAPIPSPPVAFLDDITSASRLDVAGLQARYPGHRVTTEGRTLSLHRGEQLVASFDLDAANQVIGFDLYGRGPKVAGTDLQIGASFAEVAAAVPLTGCTAEVGEDTLLECTAGRTVFTWILAPGQAAGERTVAEARKLVGERRLDHVSDRGPRP